MGFIKFIFIITAAVCVADPGVWEKLEKGSENKGVLKSVELAGGEISVEIESAGDQSIVRGKLCAEPISPSITDAVAQTNLTRKYDALSTAQKNKTPVVYGRSGPWSPCLTYVTAESGQK